jgi:hypothetical protein
MLSFDQSSYSHYHPPPSSAAAMTVHKSPAGTRHKHLFIVTGPAGCGKTTVAEYLADWSGLPYLEGDDVSSPFSSARPRLTAPVPPAGQRRQNDRRHGPHRRRPLGLAHPAA